MCYILPVSKDMNSNHIPRLTFVTYIYMHMYYIFTTLVKKVYEQLKRQKQQCTPCISKDEKKLYLSLMWNFSNEACMLLCNIVILTVIVSLLFFTACASITAYLGDNDGLLGALVRSVHILWSGTWNQVVANIYRIFKMRYCQHSVRFSLHLINQRESERQWVRTGGCKILKGNWWKRKIEKHQAAVVAIIVNWGL